MPGSGSVCLCALVSAVPTSHPLFLAGGMCPFRHISGEKTVVCKHWLRGLCKKGDQCEFLHEYDMTKMPECYFYSKFGEHTWQVGRDRLRLPAVCFPPEHWHLH